MARKRLIYAAVALFLTAEALTTETAFAQEERPAAFDISVVDYASAGAFAAGLALVYFGTKPPSIARFRSNSFDDGLRDSLRLESESGRRVAAQTSDILQDVMIAFPILIDALLVKGVIDEQPGDALRLFVLDAQSFFLAGLISTALKNISGRRRPDDHGNHAFPSAHATAAFTGAGLMCAHHSRLRLFKDQTADDVTCALGLVAATATSALRVAADRHWASDVLVGATIGILAGYLMPSLMHDVFDPTGPRLSIAPADDGATVGIGGTF
jgi:membrane-associated phospholipid phosphatase